MKKYLIISVFAALALVGCSKATPDTPAIDNEVEQEISFMSAYYAGQTKANEAFTGANFTVRAYFTGTTKWASAKLGTDAAVYMNDVTIAKSGNDWKAAGDKRYFWPKAGQLSFIGYTGWTASANWADAQKSVLSFTETITENSDPMVSDVAVDKSIDATTMKGPVVPILFHHVASKVAFKGQAETVTGDGEGLTYVVKINSVTVKTMNTKGTYTVDGSAAEIKGAWTGQNTTADLAYLATPQTVNGTAAALGNKGEVTVLPQSVASLKANVSYTIEVYKTGGSEPMATATYETSVGLNAGSISAWAPNTKYTYVIKISPVTGEITFAPEVAPWVGGGTGSIDIK